MSDLTIHQLVHGYEHGHSLLAASTELERDDLDLIGRLSDLSGALGPDLGLCSYLSFYPLPSKRFFAVARTWPDESASRSGCVLTQTILIPADIWATDDSPNRFASAFRVPARGTLGDYSVPAKSVMAASSRVISSEPLGECFIQRYFGEGLAPIVWLGAKNPESAAWCVIQALWPSLRARFACCTLALQPRTLGDRPFDLVFAPPSVASRFVDFARSHIVDGRATLGASTTESWFGYWSTCVFDGSPFEACEQVRKLSSNLEPYATAIRSVLLFLELKKRSVDSPTAALGALDLLEKLALGNSRAQEEKFALVTAAKRSIERLPAHDARELLYLLCGRLEEYSLVPDQELQADIRNLVHKLIRDDPQQGITDAGVLTTRHAAAAPGLYMLGVGDALTGMLGAFAIESLLLQQTRLMENLIPHRPEIPALILRTSGLDNRKRTISSIVDWCRAERVCRVRQTLRLTLLPEIANSDDAPLLEELLRDLGCEEVAEVCEIIAKQAAFRFRPLSDIVGRLVGERQSENVRLWSRTHDWSSYQAAAVIAASYSNTEEGLNELLSTATNDSANCSLLLAAFIERASAYSPPGWLLAHLEEDYKCWEVLVDGMSDQAVVDVVMNVIRGGLRRSRIAQVTHAARKIGGVSGRNSSALQEYAIRQLLADYVEETCEIDKVEAWFEERWVQDVLTHARTDSANAIITYQLKRSSSSWVRIWNVIEKTPNAVVFENDRLIVEIISILLRADSARWTVGVADKWRSLLSKVSGGDCVRINLCGQALHFALEHPHLPLGGVVAEAFYPVHDAAMAQQPDRGPWFLWGFGTWDKAKDLRRSLVDSFLQSDWSASHFVLAAREPWLLRKVCTRMLRQWKGQQFLDRAYSELRGVRSPRTLELLSVLRDIMQSPETAEEWD